MTFDWVNLQVNAMLVLRHKQGRRQKNFQGKEGATEKRPKIALLSLFQGGRQRKKSRKIALLNLYLLYLYHAWKSRGGTPPSPDADTHSYKVGLLY